jgi:hypothetical protein
MVVKNKVRKSKKTKSRKVKGSIFGLSVVRNRTTSASTPVLNYTESRESKRQRIMAERIAKANVKAEAKENDRLISLQKLERRTELANAIAKARIAEHKARQSHPLRRFAVGVTKGVSKTKKRTKRSKITMF